MSMKCNKCGVENATDARFCKNCGGSLSPEPSHEITTATDKLSVKDFIIERRFKVIERLGKGGMGEVLLAEDVKLKRQVAIKSILTSNLSDPTAKLRFIREAQTASQLDHPNLCTIYETYEEDEHDYIVMQYVDGVTLDQIIKFNPLGITKTLDIALQICSGMIEAHSKDIIHRDLKPGNIMIDKRGVVKILDFGLAKFKETSIEQPKAHFDSNLTEKGIVLGTVCYLSPEQASGKPLDHRTDIFSFGVLMYEMLEANNPFKRDEQIDTLYNVLNKEVTFTRNIPEELKAILLKTLSKEKKERFDSFEQISAALEHFRSLYRKLKEKKDKEFAVAGTEVIDTREQKKLAKEVQKTSDKDGLGDLVYKIKRYKAYTEPVYSTRRSKIKWLLIPLAIILILLTGYYVLDKYVLDGKNDITPIDTDSHEKFYIYLHPFTNKTNEKGLSEKVDFLVTESLNQFDQFKVITRAQALSILGQKPNDPIDLKKLVTKFNVKYELTGKVSKVGNNFTIEGLLSPLSTGDKTHSLTIVGTSLDSFLTHQVDSLSKRVYRIFLPDEKFHDLNLKRLGRIYGSNWETFCHLYRGLQYKERLEVGRAKKYLIKAQDILISTYYLADLYYFEDNRGMAIKRINSLIPHLPKLTSPLKSRVLAFRARLNVDFKKEIENLEKLKNDFSFSKEAFFELGEAYFHHGNAQKAMEYYQKALELDPRYSKALNHLGYCYSYIGNHAKAIEALEDYRGLDRSVNSFDSLGDGYFYAGDYIQAESLKELAVSTDEKDVDWAYLTLADIDILKARYNKANISLDRFQALRRSSRQDTAGVLSKKACIHYLNHDYKEALKTINQSLSVFDSKELKDNTAEAHWLKGIILVAMKDDEECRLQLDWLEDFIGKYKLSEDNFLAPFKYFLHLDALIREIDGEPVKAEANFTRLIKMKTQLSYWITYYNYQFFHTEYVDFLIRNNRHQDALTEVEHCLGFNANYIPALWRKGELLDRANSHDRFDVYNKIDELYGISDEKNYWRDRLREKYK